MANWFHGETTLASGRSADAAFRSLNYFAPCGAYNEISDSILGNAVGLDKIRDLAAIDTESFRNR